MKTHTVIVAVLSAVLLSGASAHAQTCRHSSWNPELYSFYGAKDTILEKLANIPTKPSEHRVFLQVTQGDGSADVKLYEQQSDGTFTVTEWTPKQTSDLLADIDKAIVANKGVNCVGEQVKGILAKQLKEGKVSKEVPAPESAKAAFTHPVKEATGDFIKSAVIVLC